MNREIVQNIIPFLRSSELLAVLRVSRLFYLEAWREIRKRFPTDYQLFNEIEIVKSPRFFNARDMMELRTGPVVIDHFLISSGKVLNLKDERVSELVYPHYVPKKKRDIYYQASTDHDCAVYDKDFKFLSKFALGPDAVDVFQSGPVDRPCKQHLLNLVGHEIYYLRDGKTFQVVAGTTKEVDFPGLEHVWTMSSFDVKTRCALINDLLFVQCPDSLKIFNFKNGKKLVFNIKTFYYTLYLGSACNCYYFYNCVNQLIIVIDIVARKVNMIDECREPNMTDSGIVYGLSHDNSMLYVIYGRRVHQIPLDRYFESVYLSANTFRLFSMIGEFHLTL